MITSVVTTIIGRLGHTICYQASLTPDAGAPLLINLLNSIVYILGSLFTGVVVADMLLLSSGVCREQMPSPPSIPEAPD